MAISRIETSVARIANDAVYGSGVDGDVVITTNTNITSDTYYRNLTVDAGVVLNTNGFRVFVKNTLTLNGYIGIGTAPAGVVGPAASTVANGTVGGHTTGAITYRAGGSGGTDSSTVLPSFLFKSINAMSGGVFTHTDTGVTPIRGGGFGGAGANGAAVTPLTNSDTWPGKAGAVGTAGSATGSVNGVPNPYKDTVSVPGGKGAPGADGNVTGWTAGTPGTGGAGGLGGGVVCVVAKVIVGSGKFISIGNTGGTATNGTTGNAGTQGANGAKAPDLAYHVAPTANHVAPTHNPGHHHGHVTFADFHAHIVNPHPHCCASHNAASHYGGQHYPGEHVAGTKHHGEHHNPASHNAASHYGGQHYPGHNHNSGHYHHTGGRHHPHSNDGHGVLTHIHNWPSVIHTAAKANHAGQHSHPATTGHFYGRIIHQHAGGHDGHIHAAQATPGHTHTYANGSDLGNGVNQGGGMQASGGHHHGPHTYSNGYLSAARHSHHANPNTHTPQPNGHWTGGAGGVNNGTTFGRGAPALQAPNGTHGGPGGGGAILVVTDSVSGTITYNTGGGSVLAAGGNPAGSGTAYVLLNT